MSDKFTSIIVRALLATDDIDALNSLRGFRRAWEGAGYDLHKLVVVNLEENERVDTAGSRWMRQDIERREKALGPPFA